MSKTVPCDNCGDDLTVYPSEIDKYNNHFCDNSCKTEYESESLSGDNHWRSGSGNYENCDVCDERFYRRPSRVKDKNFCSTSCESEYISKRQTGDSNSNWAGGVGGQKYGQNWRQKRNEVLERDDNSCKICNMKREEHYNKYECDLNVHHKIPIDEFDEPENANYLINLVTTCISCHGQLDKISRREANRKPSISNKKLT